MKNAPRDSNKDRNHSDSAETSLKGTFTSVLIIAVFMLVSWFSVFILFLERN